MPSRLMLPSRFFLNGNAAAYSAVTTCGLISFAHCFLISRCDMIFVLMPIFHMTNTFNYTDYDASASSDSCLGTEVVAAFLCIVNLVTNMITDIAMMAYPI